jgi:ribosomal protein S12 methylthiotransferase
MKQSMKINLVSLGCPKNCVDSEKILGALGASGSIICANPEESDIIIINTCGFIEPAIRETEQEIERALQITSKTAKRVFVYGCAVNRAGPELKRKYPGVAAWFTLEQQSALLRTIQPHATTYQTRLVTTQGYAYLKIAEGCSNHCSYCTIPSIKGEYRSFDFNSIIQEAIELSHLGIKELILIAQDTTRYGIDLYNRNMLVPLIRELSQIDTIQWIRIMYSNPLTITDEIIDEINSNNKVCRYLDIPIQHINNRILQRMNRKVDRKRIEYVIDTLRNIKGIYLRTTIIAGFPTETNDEFKELLHYLKQTKFDWLGVFPYFCEPGTPASKFEHVTPTIIDERYNALIELQEAIIKENNTRRIGDIYTTLIHSQNGHYIGHTEHEAPDIDGQIIVNNKQLTIGEFYRLKIRDIQGADLHAYAD